MPQLVTCPDCGRKLRVPDNLLGRNVKCPGCGQKFLADAGAAPAAAPRAPGTAFRFEEEPAPRRRDDEDAARPSRRRRDEPEDEDYPAPSRRDDDYAGGPEPNRADVRTGWERVRFGVNLLIISVWVLVGALGTAFTGFLLMFLFGVASFASLAGNFSGSGPATQAQMNQAAGQVAGTGVALMVGGCLLWGLLALLVLAGAALRYTGLGFFMGVAPTRKTQYLRVLAIITFCCALGGLLLPGMLLGLRVALAGSAPYQVEGCLGFAQMGLQVVLGLTEYVCFFLFLRGVAAAMRKHNLATNIVIYMISVPVYGLLYGVALVIFFFAGVMAMFGAASASANSSASTAAGNMAGAGAAMAVAGLTCMGLMILIGIALFVWYIILLYRVRGALNGWLDRN